MNRPTLITLLLTKVIPDSDFPSYSLISVSWSRIPARTPYVIYLSCFLRFSLAVAVSQTFLIFGDLGSLEECWSGILKNALVLEFGVSLVVRLAWWVWGRWTTEMMCSFHHILSRMQVINVTYHHHCWPWSLSWGWLHFSVQFSHSVMSDSLQPHESQHARPSCPSPTPGVQSNSCPSSRWCHPAIAFSVIPFSSCLQFLPASFLGSCTMLCCWEV